MTDASTEQKSLFQMSAGDASKFVRELVREQEQTHPIKAKFTAGLLLAEAATQRLALSAMRREIHPDSLERLIGATDFVEWLTKFLFDSKPPRIDLVLWDAKGFVFGWFLDDDGKHELKCSCPEAMFDLSRALNVFSQLDTEWSEILLDYAKDLLMMWRYSRDKHVLIFEQQRAAQSWWQRTFKPLTEEVQAIKEGFRLNRDVPF